MSENGHNRLFISDCQVCTAGSVCTEGQCCRYTTGMVLTGHKRA